MPAKSYTLTFIGGRITDNQVTGVWPPFNFYDKFPPSVVRANNGVIDMSGRLGGDRSRDSSFKRFWLLPPCVSNITWKIKLSGNPDEIDEKIHPNWYVHLGSLPYAGSSNYPVFSNYNLWVGGIYTLGTAHRESWKLVGPQYEEIWKYLWDNRAFGNDVGVHGGSPYDTELVLFDNATVTPRDSWGFFGSYIEMPVAQGNENLPYTYKVTISDLDKYEYWYNNIVFESTGFPARNNFEKLTYPLDKNAFTFYGDADLAETGFLDPQTLDDNTAVQTFIPAARESGYNLKDYTPEKVSAENGVVGKSVLLGIKTGNRFTFDPAVPAWSTRYRFCVYLPPGAKKITLKLENLPTMKNGVPAQVNFQFGYFYGARYGTFGNTVNFVPWSGARAGTGVIEFNGNDPAKYTSVKNTDELLTAFYTGKTMNVCASTASDKELVLFEDAVIKDPSKTFGWVYLKVFYDKETVESDFIRVNLTTTVDTTEYKDWYTAVGWTKINYPISGIGIYPPGVQPGSGIKPTTPSINNPTFPNNPSKPSTPVVVVRSPTVKLKTPPKAWKKATTLTDSFKKVTRGR